MEILRRVWKMSGVLEMCVCVRVHTHTHTRLYLCLLLNHKPHEDRLTLIHCYGLRTQKSTCYKVETECLLN